MINKIGLSLITMFGIGYVKYVPGTVASFITCLIFYLLFSMGVNFNSFFLFIFVILLICSIVLIDKLSHHFKEKDPKEIVIDEFFGQSIPLVLMWGYIISSGEVYPFFLAFILFRFFDIYKPFPINIVDKKMKNGLGIMLDDIIAGIYSTIAGVIIWALWF